MSKPEQKVGFPETRWSLVTSTHGNDTQARRAMEEICSIYWYPIYAFSRGMGLSPADAEDITQSFFAKMIHESMIKRAKPGAGKLRSYLVASVRNHINYVKRRDRAKKRGGEFTFLSIDQEEAEGRYFAEATSDENPDRAFERRWAMALLDAAMARLRKSYASRGNSETFDALSPLLSEADRGSDYREAAAKLTITEGAVRVGVFRLRKRFRLLVREEIAETVSDPAEIDDEIEALFTALAR